MIKKEALLNSLKEGRIAQAYILTGDDDEALLELCELCANTVVCESERNKPCGVCEGCRLFKANSHPDVHRMIPEPKRKTIGVETIRSYIEEISRHNARSKTRVGIIKNAHAMTPEAQNAFLKTLEEPPPNTVFILTGIVNGLLPTVRSRCFTLHIAGDRHPVKEHGEKAAQAEAVLKAVKKGKEPDRELIPKGRDELEAFLGLMSDMLSETVEEGAMTFAQFIAAADAVTNARRSLTRYTNQGLIGDRLITELLSAFAKSNGQLS